MLIGYVSDEQYLALPGVDVEIENDDGSVAARSRASGAVVADVEPGRCTVTLSKPGYGAKRVEMAVAADQPFQFRLLADCLLGYMWPKWVRAGEQAEWRVHSPEAYKLGLWRYGFEKEFVRNLGWYDEHGPRPLIQIIPDGDFTQTGVEWNRVGYAMTWHKQRVEAPARSGLYYLHAKTAGGRFFSFPWIVSPSEPQAKVAVLTSNITWNAYNNFGGRSNYVNQAGLPAKPTVNARQDLERYTNPDRWPYTETAAPLSFDRPDPRNFVPEDARITDQIEGRSAAVMAPGEWRLLGWLEREGFDHDLYSEVELHFGTCPLDDYKVLVLNTHPEYWSKEMYFRVKQWVFEQGGRLLNLAGCGLHAEVEFPDQQTTLCRIEGKYDLRQEPAASLLGVEYTHSGFNSGAPYRVIDESSWVFAGTGLKNGDLFGTRNQIERCSGGASSLELDKITKNSPANLQHLARGTNDGDQGGDAVLFETPSGGTVFSAGSLGWPLSLLVDEPISIITANILNRFLE